MPFLRTSPFVCGDQRKLHIGNTGKNAAQRSRFPYVLIGYKSSFFRIKFRTGKAIPLTFLPAQRVSTRF